MFEALMALISQFFSTAGPAAAAAVPDTLAAGGATLATSGNAAAGIPGLMQASMMSGPITETAVSSIDPVMGAALPDFGYTGIGPLGGGSMADAIRNPVFSIMGESRFPAAATPPFMPSPGGAGAIPSVQKPNPWMTGMGSMADVLKARLARPPVDRRMAAPDVRMTGGATRPLQFAPSAIRKRPSPLERYSMMLRSM